MPVECVCLGSGPSLTAEDIETVRKWRDGFSLGRFVVVTNTTFRSALWADVLFAMDGKWWNAKPGDSGFTSFALEAKATFKGRLVTASQSYKTHKIEFSRHVTFGNTGAGAIHWAYHNGARRIILLGYDCQKTGGKAHHHGDHPKPLYNALTMSSWPDQFKRLADALKGKAEIINCSRETALKCFPRMPLEDALAKTAQAA